MTLSDGPAPIVRKERPASTALAMLSFGAAAIHFAVIAEHFDEAALFGVFFVVVAWLQVAWGILAITGPSRAVLAAGVVGNLAVAAIWMLSRTTGLPVGPEAGTAEPVGFADALAMAFESVIVIGGAWLLRAPRTRAAPGRAAKLLLSGVAISVVSLTSVSLALLEGHGDSHEAGESAKLPVVPQVLTSNGQEFRIDGLGSARVELRPYPPRSRTHLALTLIESDGHPHDADEIHIAYDMKMPHGGSETELEAVAEGVYETELRFTMGGSWNLVFDIAARGKRHIFAIEVRIPFGG